MPVHIHKPFVLRLPFLVLYLSAFGLCIGLIERLLARTSQPETSSLEKREQTICTNAIGWSSRLQPLEVSYSSICRDFSATFATHTTSLSPALQTAFGQWLLQQSSITRAQWSISQSSFTCSLQSVGLEYCPDGLRETGYRTAGCISSLTSYDPCCPGHGTISLLSSSIIASGFPNLPCAVTRASQLAITSQTGSLTIPRSSLLAISSQAVSSAVPQTSQSAATLYLTSSKNPAIVSAVPKSSQLAVTSAKSDKYSLSSIGVTTSIPVNTNQTSSSSINVLLSTSSNPIPSTPKFFVGTHEVIETGAFTQESYFFALYLAPIIAIFLKAIHEMIVATVKLLEPFHLLREAAHMTYPAIAQYLSSSISMDVYQSMSQRRYLPLLTVSMYFLMPLLTPIASASMSVRSRDTCTVDGIRMRCDPVWIVNVTAMRCLEVLLGLCCVLVLMLISSTWTYQSPLSYNPASIASIATLLIDDSVPAALMSIDPEASEKGFNTALEQYKFWIADPDSSFMQGVQCRLMCSRTSFHNAETAKAYALVGEQPAGRAQRLKTMFSDVTMLLSTLTLLALIITYTFDYQRDEFNSFFTSQKALPKLILVGLATIVDVAFKYLERVVRITEPYRRLSLGNARPETTILIPLHGTSWSNLPRCIYSLCKFRDSRMLWQTIVGISACLSDLNVVAVSGILFTDAQTPEAFEICSYMAIAITIIMSLVAATTFFWWRRQGAVLNMPHQTDTIGAVSSYLCGSRMVREWINSVRHVSLTDSERYKAIATSGRRFKFGRTRCKDGVVRWCIDFDDDHETLEISSMYGRGDRQGKKLIVTAAAVET